MKAIRIDKYLADMGLGSRAEMKSAMKKGQVTVDGVIIKKPETKVVPGENTILFNGQAVDYVKYIYYVLHKPAGCVTATEDNLHKTVMDYIEDDRRTELFPVGRLDIDTEGLLLITNDGELAHQLLSPKKHVSKVYYVELADPLKETDVKAFAAGLDIGDDKPALPAKLKILDERSAEVEIVEGRFHQVKRMFKAVDNEVIYLRRIQMGTLRLEDDLRPGEYRKLTDDELEQLKNR